MSIKLELLDACKAHVKKRISSYKEEIEIIKDAIENNDKGNEDGDDSGSGKLHDDLENNSKYLNDAHKMMDTLELINPKIKHDYAALGSLVKTDSSTFFLAISLGKVEVAEQSIFVISKGSPIGELLLHKEVGDSIRFNTSTYKITEII